MKHSNCNSVHILQLVNAYGFVITVSSLDISWWGMRWQIIASEYLYVHVCSQGDNTVVPPFITETFFCCICLSLLVTIQAAQIHKKYLQDSAKDLCDTC